jgi:hypothetical protein
MAMWVRRIVLTVVAVVPVIAGEIVRLTDHAPASPPAAVTLGVAGDCALSELRWRTLEPPSTHARARGGALRGC